MEEFLPDSKASLFYFSTSKLRDNKGYGKGGFTYPPDNGFGMI